MKKNLFWPACFYKINVLYLQQSLSHFHYFTFTLVCWICILEGRMRGSGPFPCNNLIDVLVIELYL